MVQCMYEIKCVITCITFNFFANSGGTLNPRLLRAIEGLKRVFHFNFPKLVFFLKINK